MNWIEVTQRIDRELATVCIDADLIDYIKPHLVSCGIHFTNGQSVVVAESPQALRQLIQENKNRRK